MLAIAILMGVASMPGQTVLLALYNASIRNALGLSITQLSIAYTLGTIAAALPLPLVGRIADRIGLRLTIAAVSAAFSASLLLLGEARGIVSLGLAFFLIRFLGQGALSMLAGHTISLWFERRLGTVHSLLAVIGFGVSSALLPQPVAWLIAEHGWKASLAVSAIAVAMLTLPFAVFFFRNRPADIGQHLDGDPAEPPAHDVLHGGPPPPGDPAFTIRQAATTRAFWMLGLIMLASGFIGTALLFHMQTMLQQAGLEGTERQAALAFQSWPIVFAVSMLAMGTLADRFRPALLMPIALLLQMIAVLACLSATRAVPPTDLVLPLMSVGMGLYGASQACVFGVGNPTIARYFGRTHHGAIRGVISTATVLGTGGGPYIVALAYDLAENDFTPVMLALAASSIPLGLFARGLRQPAPPARRDLTPEPDLPDPPPMAM